MKRYLKITVFLIAAAITITSVPVGAAKLGKVKAVSTKKANKYYKGYISADKPPTKIKYQYGTKATWKKVKGAAGYEIQTYGFATKKWKTIKTTKKTYYVFTSLLKKSKVRFRVRAYKKENGSNIYGSWSKAKTITAKQELFKRDKNGVTKKYINERYSAEMAFKKQNEYRKAAGSKALIWSEAIYEICLERAKDLEKYDFSHDRFDSTADRVLREKYGVENKEIVTVIDDTNYYEMLLCAENISMGKRTYIEAMESWKSSKWHNINLTNSDSVSGAIACYKGESTVYWVAIFSGFDCDKKIIEITKDK